MGAPPRVAGAQAGLSFPVLDFLSDWGCGSLEEGQQPPRSRALVCDGRTRLCARLSVQHGVSGLWANSGARPRALSMGRCRNRHVEPVTLLRQGYGMIASEPQSSCSEAATCE